MISEPAHRDAKILIVDDQEGNVQLMQRILREGGYRHFRGLIHSSEALAVYQEFQPDLIVLDLMMPHPDGVAVMDQLRPLRHGTYLPVLVLTADVATDAKVGALNAGATDFLTKPVDVVEVLLRIRNLLETRFLYQRLQQSADERIREQAALLDSANDAILVRDMDDRITYWNRGAERLYGWTGAEAEGRCASDLLAKEPAEAALAEAAVSAQVNGHWQGELRQVTKKSREVIVASRWTLLRDAAGEPKSLLIINSDLTEKKKLEARLLQGHRMEAIGALAGGVAHDFNNLLTVIIGSSDMALEHLCSQHPAHDLVHEIRKSGERAAGLTRQLLAFSRKQVLAPVTLDLNQLVRESERMLRRLIGEDVGLATVLAKETLWVRADPVQLEQVLMNLVVNARDAMPQGGQLTIETRSVEGAAGSPQQTGVQGSCVLLQVTDTGQGMDEATRAKIFEPFFTTKEVGKGTGLGLATVYGIVSQSGGSIEVESRQGVGTTFRIYLPASSADAAVAEPRSPTAPEPDGGARTVLLVEDEDGVRAVTSRVLRSAGYTVLEARDGEDALGLCARVKRPIDILVTDVVMPKMSGPQLATRLARERPDLKVLYISGYTDDAAVRHGVKEEAMPFLQKPFTPTALVHKVDELLRKRGRSSNPDDPKHGALALSDCFEGRVDRR